MIMTYKIGISSGWWKIGRDPNLLGLATKAGGFGATSGVTFNQVDLDTTAEFYEPRLKEQITRTKKELGIEVGLHAEIGQLAALESAERKFWEQSHLRLIETVKNAAELGFIYINFHMSNTIQLYQEEGQRKPFGHTVQMVGPDGRPLHFLADKSNAARKYLLERIKTNRAGSIDDDILKNENQRVRKKYAEQMNRELEQLVNEYRKRLEEDLNRQNIHGPEREPYIKKVLADYRNSESSRLEREYDIRAEQELVNGFYELWKKSRFGQYFIEYGEIGAYQAVAEYLYEKKDSVWKSNCGDSNPTDAYTRNQKGYNAAVGCAYIEGHLTVKDHEYNKKYLGGKSVLEFINEKKLYLVFETPEVEGGVEGLNRIYDPRDFYPFIKKIGSPWIKFCIDFEHTMSQKLDPTDVFKTSPSDFGKYVYLIHLGEPKPYFGQAHIPLSIGSLGQEIIYEWLYMLRQKGFKDGIMLFERGSGRGGGGRGTPAEVFESSVWVIRKLAEYLDKDTKPENLPPEFFGVSEQNKEVWARQVVEMRNHAWDPLEGLLMIPEEKHTFLGKAAVDKGKAQEWEKRKYR